MNIKDIQMFYSWFHHYIKQFTYNDEKIRANMYNKKQHTFRVCKNAISLAKSQNLSDQQIYTAQAIGLFHDVGRFEQFFRYKTYRDEISVDHANLSVSILKKYDVLKHISSVESEIILKAVAYHNKYAIPNDLSDAELLFSKVIRDADKLDIFNMIIDYYENPHFYKNEAFEDFPDRDEYKPSIVEDIINSKNVSYHDVKTKTDIKLLRISWIYDINFNQSLQIIKDKAYIERIIKFLPCSVDISRLHAHVNNYINGRLQTL